MKKNKDSRGAVSVFLIIILVPMLLISSIFVDASRFKLAKGVADSAGELVLNSALTHYDTDLKDLYGLFATAQDTDELYEKLEDYYRLSMISAGLSEKDADSYISQIMDGLGAVSKSGDVADLLNIQLIDFGVSKNTDLTLANASVLKKQVVDFMKYRAPINTGLSFVTSLKSFTTLSKQTELVEKRQEYYEAEKTVMEAAQSAWTSINEYNKTDIVKNKNYLNELKALLSSTDENSIKNIYESSAKKTVKDLYDTQSYAYYDGYYWKFSKEGQQINNETKQVWLLKNGTNVKKHYGEYTTYSDSEKASLSDIKTLISNYHSKLKTFESYYQNYKDEVKPNMVASNYGLQVLVQYKRLNKMSIITNYVGTMTNSGGLYELYSKLKHAVSYHEDEPNVMLETISIDNGRISGTVGDLYNAIRDEFEGTLTNQYNSTIDEVNGYFQAIENAINNSNQTSTSGVQTKLSAMAEKINKYLNTLKTAVDRLSEAITNLNTVLDGVKEGGDLDNKANKWKEVANDSTVKNTSMAVQDRAEINSLNDYLNPEDVQKLITRLTKIKENINNVLLELDKYKYMDKPISEIDSYESLKNLLSEKIGDQQLKSVPLNKDSLEAKAKEWCENKLTNGNINVSWVNDKNQSPILHGEKVDTLKFYAYLYTHFNQGEVSTKTEMKVESKSNGKEMESSLKKIKSDATKNATQVDNNEVTTENEIKNISIKPSKSGGNPDAYSSVDYSSGDAITNTNTGLSGMLASICDAIKKMGAKFRDNLYFTDYVMSMFSYDTIEKETAFKNKNNVNVNEKTVSIETLTKNPINSENNYAYRREIEYVVYGGANKENVMNAYSSIYGFRLAFNMIYAFSASQIRDAAFSMATPISAATLGVVPVPLIQAAIIVGMACCESAIDIKDLRAGKPVVLLKSDDTWKSSIEVLVKEATSTASTLINNGINKKIDEAVTKGFSELNKWLDMTDEQLSEVITKGESYATNLLNKAFDELVTRHADTAIQKLTTAIINSIEKYKMGAIQENQIKSYIESELDKWLTSGEGIGDTLGKEICGAAVQVIKTYCNDTIDELIQLIMESQETAVTTISEVSRKMNLLIEQIKIQITTEVTRVSESVKSYKDQFISSTREAIKGGADKLKESLQSNLGNLFGESESNDESGVSSVMDFYYSDYLKLFVLIGLYTNEETIILRCADAIQSNMNLKNDGYDITKASTYVNVTADIQIKPLLLALPLFSDVEDNPATSQKYYTFQEKITKGY